MASGFRFFRTSFQDANPFSADFTAGIDLLAVLLLSLLLAPLGARAGGTVNDLSQTALESAMADGGIVTFGTSGELLLTNTIFVARNTALKAEGQAVVISGGNSARLFQVASNVSFRMEGVALANGRVAVPASLPGSPPLAGSDARGAAILNQGGRVTLIDCTVTNHFVRGGDAGADTAQQIGAPGGSGHGAGIWSFAGELYLTNCVFADNRAEGGLASSVVYGLSAASGDATGAGIHVEYGRVSLHAVEFASNVAEGGAPVGGDGLVGDAGKAGDAVGAALFVSNSVATLVSCRITSNQALGGDSPIVVSHGHGSGHAYGGGLFLDSNSVAEVRSSVFTNNAAIAGFGRRNEPGGNGGGGGVYSEGTLRVFDSTFFTNRAEGGSSRYPGMARGGAIFSGTALAVTGSLFDRNEACAGNFALEANVAGEGGALWCSGELFLTNSTFALNKAAGGTVTPAPIGVIQGGPARGGAIFIQGGTGLMLNATLSENTAEAGQSAQGLPPAPAEGGALFATNSQFMVRNSIFAHSPKGGDVSGAILDGGYNIASDSSAAFSAEGSLSNTDPMLAALALNGGPTATMALLAGSPARDAVPTSFPALDQRGAARPQGPAADIGAFEADFISAYPSIIHQPLSQTVRLGSNAVLSVAAAGTPPLWYHWEKDGELIPGATNSHYGLTNVQLADAGSYSVVVSNTAGATSSQPATLSVSAEPLILSQPVSIEVSPGEAATFTVMADGPELRFQWWQNGTPIGGATNAILEIAAALAGSQGEYQVAVANFAGATNSQPAQLTFGPTALTILVPPPDRSVESGYPATFEVLASGVPPFSYQWFHDGVAIAAATNISFTIPITSAKDAGAYAVVVTNAYRAVTSEPALLTLSPGATPVWLAIARYGSTVTVTFEAQAGRTYRLFSSPNFRDWSLAGATTVVGPGTIQFTKPNQTNAALFYRVVTP